MASINELARDGLNDTRQAVSKLADTTQPGHANEDSTGLHRWDEIGTILQHARDAGIAAVLTETGRRPDDERQASLCFTISREAITNALRHGHAVSRIVVSWDHAHDGSTTLTVRDNGTSSATPQVQGTGMGLSRLARQIASLGGEMHYGPVPEAGWQVKARIPSTPAPATTGMGGAS